MSEEKKVKGKGKGKGLKILVILLVLIIALGGGFGAYLLLFKKADTTATGQTGALPANAVPNYATSEGTSKITAPLDDFLVNLSDEGGKKYMKVTIVLGYDNKKLTAEITEKTPMIRDAINSVLRAKKSADLNTKGVEDLKTEIGNRINPLFENGRVNHIYFSNIIIQ